MPGRVTPPDYHYRPDDIRVSAPLSADTILVAGGLYGNPFAATAILERAAGESGMVVVVFNGDIHYLDASPDAFTQVVGATAGQRSTLGNVEYAISSGDEAIGCGCAYPDYVPDRIVERSNQVVARLRLTAADHPDHVAALQALPRWLVVEIEGRRVGVVHGDLNSVAGWSLAVENLEPADTAARSYTGWSGASTTAQDLEVLLARAGLHVLCCTHTGLPYGQRSDRRVVINNGMAGLPCLHERRHGVITRVSIDPAPPADRLYGTRLDGLRIDAVAVHYDHAAWRDMFEDIWPRGSAGHRGYAHRLLHGPTYSLVQAARAGFTL